MRVVTSAQMKEIEQASLKYDLTYQRLMENAGSAAAAFIRRTFRLEGLNCMIFCGGGNNGGDGMVVARKLFESDANVLAVLVGDLPKSPEATSMYATARMMEIPIADFSQNQERILEVMTEADIIVDAIYGTGFHGQLNDTVRTICAAINDAIAAVVALDIPSGVNCDTAVSDPDAIRADFTIAFDSHKPVHMLAQAAPYCGEVVLVDIGIPDEARQGILPRHGTLNADMVFQHLPPRAPDAHKGTHGHVLSICGSARYRGAAVLSSLGALRAGVGLLTLASTERVCAAAATQVLEATYLPLPENSVQGIDSAAATALIEQALPTATAVLFGCGLGNHRDTAVLLALLLKEAECPIILDADGINVLDGNINVLQEASAPVILTPHPGEMARLSGRSILEIESDRSGVAQQCAVDANAVVLLKGRETVIAEPKGGLLLNKTGNAGLAKGGSGDILAGMIAAFAAQGIEPFFAASFAAFLHGQAADRTAARRSQYGMLPSELLDDLTAIFAENDR